MSRSTDYKILAIDVDGTLLFGHEKISQANREAIEEVKKHAMVSLCTGRAPGDAGWILDELDLRDNFHVLGGGAILYKPGGDLGHLGVIDHDIVACIKDEMSKHPLFFLSNGLWSAEMAHPNNLYNSVSALALEENMANDVADRLREICKNHFVTTVADKNNYWIQVTAPDCHKGTGLTALLGQVGANHDQVLAIGDMYNDIPMFEAVPFSVAMGNAPEDVKNKAAFVTKEVHNDGLAHAIWEFFFK